MSENHTPFKGGSVLSECCAGVNSPTCKICCCRRPTTDLRFRRRTDLRIGRHIHHISIQSAPRRKRGETLRHSPPLFRAPVLLPSRGAFSIADSGESEALTRPSPRNLAQKTTRGHAGITITGVRCEESWNVRAPGNSHRTLALVVVSRSARHTLNTLVAL